VLAEDGEPEVGGRAHGWPSLQSSSS
jgi:hypothetical protein